MNFLYSTLTQGGADAFIQNTLSLPQQAGFALDLREVLIEWPRLSLVAASNAEIAMTRKSFAAMPDILQPSLVWKKKFLIELATNGGYITDQGIMQLTFPSKSFQLVELQSFLQLDSNATTQTLVVKVRLGYEIVKISQLDAALIQAQTLAS